MTILLGLLLVVKVHAAGGGDHNVANVLPVVINAPQGSETSQLEVLLPTKGRTSIGNPAQLLEHVAASWEAVVEPHQAGLMDPKHSSAVAAAGLSSEEAWHHFQAGQAGVVDSARFLITFSMVPSVQTGGSRLHIAAAMGNVDQVRDLLDDGAQIDEAKDDGTTALHSAATMGHAEVVRVLVEEGSWVEATGNSGATPLMMAASMGHIGAVKALLDGGANPDTGHNYGKSTALHFAAEVGRDDVVQELCKRGANVEARKVTGGTALHSAADANQPGTVKVLVEDCEADVNRLLMKDTTPLYLAAQRGFTEVVVMLLSLGADANYVMPRGTSSTQMIHLSEGGNEGFYPVKNTELGNGATALHAAVENGHYDAAKVLLEAGAVQSNSMEGATPLVIALQYRHPNIALLLLEDGYPDPHLNAQVPSDGSSALLVAVISGYKEVVRRLLDLGADPNISTSRGVTPLSQAAALYKEDMLKTLLEAGASVGSLHDAVSTSSSVLVEQVLSTLPRPKLLKTVNARVDGLTPLHLAVKAGNKDVVLKLLKVGGDVDAKVENTGATSLHLAALQGGLEVVRILLKSGANVHAKAADALHRATPLYLAAQNGHKRVVEELVKGGADVNCRLWQMAVTPLFAASERGHQGTVTELLKLGASPHSRNWNGVTALGVAALAGHVKVVKDLLAAGAQVNSRDNDKSSVLLQTISVEEPSLSVVKELIEAGANPMLTNNRGEVVLVQAAKKDKINLPLVRLLLKHSQVDAAKEVEIEGIKFKETAFSVAVKTGKEELVRVFLEAGAISSEAVLHDDWKPGERILLPLGIAVKMKSTPIINLLLEWGARECEVKESASQQGNRKELGDCVDLAVAGRDPDIIRTLSDFIANSKTIKVEL